MENCNVTQSWWLVLKQWILTLACFTEDDVSLWTGARSFLLGDNFWISLTALRLFCCWTLWWGKTMVLLLQVNLISCRFDFLLSCFYKSWTPVICSPLVIPDLSNWTKPNKKPIEPNRTPIVRLGWAIEQNRTPILLWVRFSNQSNQYNRTKSNKIEVIQCNCLLTPQTE